MDQALSTPDVAPLNLCDRVDVLSEIVHSKENPLDKETFDTFLEQYYPCFVSLCEELRTKPRAKHVTARLHETGAKFDVSFDDGTEEQFSYEGLAADYL